MIGNEPKVVKPLRACGCFINPLPTAFSDALTYEEQVCKIEYKVNEIIEYLTNSTSEWKEYTDQQIQILKSYVDSQDLAYYNELKNQLDDSIADTQQKLAELKTYIDGKVMQLRSEFNQKIDITMAEFDVKFQNFKKEIYDLINKFTVTCFNPTNGKYETTCKVIQDLYESLRYQAATCMDFDASGITASQFDSLQMTCTEFDLYGLIKLNLNYCKCVMLSPFTGLKDTITNVIKQAIQAFGNGITATAFDSRTDITCTFFDNKALTATQFDFESSTLL